MDIDGYIQRIKVYYSLSLAFSCDFASIFETRLALAKASIDSRWFRGDGNAPDAAVVRHEGVDEIERDFGDGITSLAFFSWCNAWSDKSKD